ncbi:MAG: hypothetical protein AB7V13_28705 [Pseudorhodoplanes sp.]|uniref:hypothetical protein n=1 Tax=Pseudorhodoplanes sp. TaxID=1934341 RepID=UPI003D0E68C4
MGIVIVFPAESARVRSARSSDGTCEVVILPVIRIDRYEEEPELRPARTGATGGKRRGRVSRS